VIRQKEQQVHHQKGTLGLSIGLACLAVPGASLAVSFMSPPYKMDISKFVFFYGDDNVIQPIQLNAANMGRGLGPLKRLVPPSLKLALGGTTRDVVLSTHVEEGERVERKEE
jgi:hypothetical protein